MPGPFQAPSAKPEIRSAINVAGSCPEMVVLKASESPVMSNVAPADRFKELVLIAVPGSNCKVASLETLMAEVVRLLARESFPELT